MPLKQDEKQMVLEWISKLDIPKPTAFLHRDFSDGCLLAKLIKLYLPNLVELHNYQPAVGVQKKMDNWKTLQVKVLKKLDIKLQEKEMQDLASAKAGMIESLLWQLRQRFDDLAGQEKSQHFEEEEPEQQHPPQRIKSAQKTAHSLYEETERSPSRSTKQSQVQGCGKCKEAQSKIQDLQVEVELLEEKVDKLQQLVRIKDGKNKALAQQVEALQARLAQLE